MDPPEELSKNPYNSLSSANVSTPAMIQLATEAAEKSIMLLKNINSSLPLKAGGFSASMMLEVVCVLCAGLVPGDRPIVTCTCVAPHTVPWRLDSSY